MIVLAGPNGAGKSTAAPVLLKGELRVREFVNADLIAQGISGFAPEGAAFEAGRVMLRRIHDLAARQEDFAFETTLASRSFAPSIRGWTALGYEFTLLFLWLPTSDFAVSRVRDRVRLGGHDVAADVVRRRFVRGLRNFFSIYRPLATTWKVFDSSSKAPRLVASGGRGRRERVIDPRTWGTIQAQADDDS